MKKYVFFTLACAVMGSAYIFYALSDTYAQHNSAVKPPTVVTAQESQQWLNEDWTGNAQPYQQIEQQIDEVASNKVALKALLLSSRALAERDAKNPQAQFRWVYSGWKMLTPSSSYWDRHRYLNGAFEAMVSAPSPNVYEYARLRFMVAPSCSQLVPVGERLLRRTPSDMRMKYRVVSDYIQLLALIGTRTKRVDDKVKARAVFLARELISADPANADYYSGLAGVYVTCWATKRDQGDAAKAVAAYQDYLRLAPPDDEFRSQAQAIIKDIQQPSP